MSLRGERLASARRIGLGPLAWAGAAALPLLFLTVMFVWPVVALLVTGLSGANTVGNGQPTEVLTDPRTWRVIAQTLVQASLGTLVSVILGIPAAFVLYRLRFRGRGVVRGLATIPFVLPTVVVGVAFTAVVGPGAPLEALGVDQSLTAIVLALAFFNVTVVMRTVGSYWAQLDPRPEHAARMLGASPIRVWFTVTLPALAPAIASAAALTFLFCATSFGVVLILGGRQFSNIETEIYRLTVQFLDLRSAAVLSLVQFAIVAAVLVFSNWLRERKPQIVARSFVQGAAVRPTRAHMPVILVFLLTVIGLHVLPLFALVWQSLRGPDGQIGIQNYLYLFMPPAGSRLTGTVLDAALLSLRMAAIAAGIAMLLGVLTALVASRTPRSPLLRRARTVFESAVMLPLGVSAVTLGFGLLLTMYRPFGIGIDLRTSVVLIPLAQALIAFPLVVRILLPTLRGIDSRMRDAASLLGASPLRVLLTIDLAALGRAGGVALGFAFAVSLGEFGATAFLVRPGEQTLPVVISQLIGQQGAENYGMALAAAVVLGMLTAAVMLLAERWRGDAAGEW